MAHKALLNTRIQFLWTTGSLFACINWCLTFDFHIVFAMCTEAIHQAFWNLLIFLHLLLDNLGAQQDSFRGCAICHCSCNMVVGSDYRLIFLHMTEWSNHSHRRIQFNGSCNCSICCKSFSFQTKVVIIGKKRLWQNMTSSIFETWATKYHFHCLWWLFCFERDSCS